MKFLVVILSIGCIKALEDRQQWQHRVDIYQPFFHQLHRYRDTRSIKQQPSLLVDVPLPSRFSSVQALKRFLGISEKPERRRRRKREAFIDLASSLTQNVNPADESGSKVIPVYTRLYSNPIFELPEPQLRSEDPRKRRNSSVNDHEDDREKQMFSDADARDAREIREPTTAMPPWKKRKENSSPSFVTSGFSGPQHRSADNARESHSLKDFEKVNEIPRDNLYSATNRRTETNRNIDLNFPPSVYDTFDYNNSRRGYSRLAEDRRPNYDSFTLSRSFTYPRVYDRRPSGMNIVGRGVEYYHRNFEPASGRIVYYANLPEPMRSYDPRYSYPVYPGYVAPTYDYRGYPNPADFYSRSGRNVPAPEPTRGFYDPSNRTYVIYDADEKRSFGTNFYVRPPSYVPNQGLRNDYWLPSSGGYALTRDRLLPAAQIPLTLTNTDIAEPKKI